MSSLGLLLFIALLSLLMRLHLNLALLIYFRHPPIGKVDEYWAVTVDVGSKPRLPNVEENVPVYLHAFKPRNLEKPGDNLHAEADEIVDPTMLSSEEIFRPEDLGEPVVSRGVCSVSALHSPGFFHLFLLPVENVLILVVTVSKDWVRMDSVKQDFRFGKPVILWRNQNARGIRDSLNLKPLSRQLVYDWDLLFRTHINIWVVYQMKTDSQESRKKRARFMGFGSIIPHIQRLNFVRMSKDVEATDKLQCQITEMEPDGIVTDPQCFILGVGSNYKFIETVPAAGSNQITTTSTIHPTEKRLQVIPDSSVHYVDDSYSHQSGHLPPYLVHLKSGTSVYFTNLEETKFHNYWFSCIDVESSDPSSYLSLYLHALKSLAVESLRGNGRVNSHNVARTTEMLEKEIEDGALGEPVVSRNVCLICLIHSQSFFHVVVMPLKSPIVVVRPARDKIMFDYLKGVGKPETEVWALTNAGGVMHGKYTEDIPMKVLSGWRSSFGVYVNSWAEYQRSEITSKQKTKRAQFTGYGDIHVGKVGEGSLDSIMLQVKESQTVLQNLIIAEEQQPGNIPAIHDFLLLGIGDSYTIPDSFKKKRKLAEADQKMKDRKMKRQPWKMPEKGENVIHFVPPNQNRKTGSDSEKPINFLKRTFKGSDSREGGGATSNPNSGQRRKHEAIINFDPSNQNPKTGTNLQHSANNLDPPNQNRETGSNLQHSANNYGQPILTVAMPPINFVKRKFKGSDSTDGGGATSNRKHEAIWSATDNSPPVTASSIQPKSHEKQQSNSNSHSPSDHNINFSSMDTNPNPYPRTNLPVHNYVEPPILVNTNHAYQTTNDPQAEGLKEKNQLLDNMHAQNYEQTTTIENAHNDRHFHDGMNADHQVVLNFLHNHQFTGGTDQNKNLVATTDSNINFSSMDPNQNPYPGTNLPVHFLANTNHAYQTTNDPQEALKGENQLLDKVHAQNYEQTTTENAHDDHHFSYAMNPSHHFAGSTNHQNRQFASGANQNKNLVATTDSSRSTTPEKQQSNANINFGAWSHDQNTGSTLPSPGTNSVVHNYGHLIGQPAPYLLNTNHVYQTINHPHKGVIEQNQLLDNLNDQNHEQTTLENVHPDQDFYDAKNPYHRFVLENFLRNHQFADSTDQHDHLATTTNMRLPPSAIGDHNVDNDLYSTFHPGSAETEDHFNYAESDNLHHSNKQNTQNMPPTTNLQNMEPPKLVHLQKSFQDNANDIPVRNEANNEHAQNYQHTTMANVNHDHHFQYATNQNQQLLLDNLLLNHEFAHPTDQSMQLAATTDFSLPAREIGRPNIANNDVNVDNLHHLSNQYTENISPTTHDYYHDDHDQQNP